MLLLGLLLFFWPKVLHGDHVCEDLCGMFDFLLWLGIALILYPIVGGLLLSLFCPLSQRHNVAAHVVTAFCAAASLCAIIAFVGYVFPHLVLVNFQNR